MKKTLALILSVIMILSIMPIAYAKRVTYSTEIEQYIEDYIRLATYYNNQYKTYEQQTEVRNIISEAIDGKTEVYPYYEVLINIEADELADFHEGLKKGIEEVEAKIYAGDFVVVTDIYEWCKYEVYLAHSCYYSNENVTEVWDGSENSNSDKYIDVWNEANIGLDTIHQVVNGMGGHAIPQADFDDAMAKMRPLFDLVSACLDGNHPYGEYVSNNDATEEADGTKTATCEFCGATNTITDEGTKLEKVEEQKEEPKEEKVSFFEMIFALIKEFFEKIFSIFK